MEIEISWGEVDKSDALNEHILEQIQHALRHWTGHFMHVHAHVHDDNRDKTGHDDKRIILEARPPGHGPIVVEAQGKDLYQTVTATAKKLENAARHFVDKHRTH